MIDYDNVNNYLRIKDQIDSYKGNGLNNLRELAEKKLHETWNSLSDEEKIYIDKEA